MAFRRQAQLLALALCLAAPASAETNLQFWANVDDDFVYWMDEQAGSPAYEFPGYLCTAAAGTAPSPCVAASDPVVWDLPLRLLSPLTLDAGRNVTMSAFLSSSPCEFLAGLGCGPDTAARFDVVSALVQGNATLLDAGHQNATVLGGTVEVVWSAPANGTVLDPALGNVTWRLTVQPVAGLTNGVFLGMANGTWSGLVLPLAPPPVAAAASVQPTTTVTQTTTRTVTATTTVTHDTTVTAVETLTLDQAPDEAKGLPGVGFLGLALVVAAFALVRRRLQ